MKRRLKRNLIRLHHRGLRAECRVGAINITGRRRIFRDEEGRVQALDFVVFRSVPDRILWSILSARSGVGANRIDIIGSWLSVTLTVS